MGWLERPREETTREERVEAFGNEQMLKKEKRALEGRGPVSRKFM